MDRNALRFVGLMLDEGNLKAAKHYAAQLDTVLRDEVPDAAWDVLNGY